ncbi:gluconokinase [Cohaesibacter celericrescens]|uniref:Gluconokinase n=1 Tax=Cohaesibacter celericrescens TaxID=2067669 RepID=A0A2N5XNQ6_9HYPH|nr:gluconokinase [Cohaesibacter celericrescens]PLW76047.1 gluconokinase [Cohaesibacter celericrescens]
MLTAESQSRFNNPPIIVVMGVSGCGKSTVGAALAQRRSLPFMDADDYHPAANVAKMSQSIPLNDADRWPWFETLAKTMLEKTKMSGGVVCGCSALKKSYREFLSKQLGLPVVYVLLNGSRALLLERMSARKDHYMPVSLLDSQLDTLEMPDDDEPVVIVSIDQDLGPLIEAVDTALASFEF